MWELKGVEAAKSPEHVRAAVARPVERKQVHPKRLRVDVPVDKRADLIELSQSARRVRGWTPADSPDRLAARRFERELQMYVSRGVPVARLARVCGLTTRAIAARLERVAERQETVHAS